MNLKPFTGPGSTPSRRRFWDKVTQAVIASQKVAGRFVTVDEHPGKGTVINVADTSSRRPTGGPGACCLDGVCSIQTQSACEGSGGSYLGQGTCEGVDCTVGACCEGSTCTLTTAEGCSGTFHGYGTVCDPNPCGEPPATSRCCLPDHTCEDLTSAACIAAGGTFIAGTHCDDSACTCCSIIGAFGPGCSTGAVPDVCKTGPEQCDDPICQGETIPCDSLWLTVLEYCIHCPGSTRTLCCTSSWNPLTCELVQTDCDCGPMVCGSDGTTQEVMDQYVPCVP